ncbi:MAG: winged helix-turn-helix transcriptional regulator [Thermoplasmata archaeon]|nr:winged helix-turn-helix transcriptional regulator [Thermoplasmata archaeon]
MTGKKWLLIFTFAMILVIGLGMIIPQDVWRTGDAGSYEDDTSGLEGGDDYQYDLDNEINFIVYTNDTLSNEPVYWLDNGSYDIAYVPATPDDGNTSADNTSSESPTIGAGSTDVIDDEYLERDLWIYEDSAYKVVYDNQSSELSNSSSLALLPYSEDADESSATLGADASSIGWVFQSLGYIVVCAIIFALMFARLSNEDIMAGIRKHIYNFISENPGEHLARITKEFDMSSSSARHHLYVLEVSDKIVSHKPGKYKHYYVNQNGYSRFTNGSEYKAVISALRNDTTRSIVKVLAQGDNMNQLMLSQALSIHPSTVNWHAKRLMAADIIRKNRRGKDIIYSLNDEIDIHKMISIIEGTSS